jgi:colanic acid/amylovoran biosynthesis glycosyltransferase
LDEFPLVERQAPPNGRWRIMQACRLIPKKGVATSLRAFAIFKKDFPNAEFYIAGKGPLQWELEMLAAGLGISKDVHFVGFLPQSKLLGLYLSAHLFLHPSETPPDENQEGIPNSILEAMATGLPILATRHGGIPEAVEHGQSGFLVSEEDHVGLANSLKEIASTPGMLYEMGMRARAVVASRFEQEAQARLLESFYEEAIAIRGVEEPATMEKSPVMARQVTERVVAE